MRVNTVRRRLTMTPVLGVSLGTALVFSAGTVRSQIKSGDNPDASEMWRKVRASLFGQRSIAIASDEVITLDTPIRADDAAVVPVAMRTRLSPVASRRIQKLYLLIDNNPSPIAAVFQFSPQSGRADVETRVRVDEYSHVRAIAELNDGSLHMATRWVKASGGCSAPAGKDAQAALATLGRMKWRVEGEARVGAPALAQLMISHPNHSGLAMDQLSRQYTPAHFVRKIDISYAGQALMSADVDISISENPHLRFYFVPQATGEFKAEVEDSRDMRFASSFSHLLS